VLIDTHVAALILSLLDHVLEEESFDSKLVCGMDGAKGIAVSRIPPVLLFRPSLAVFEDAEGPPVLV
jgi:hypothetical protein